VEFGVLGTLGVVDDDGSALALGGVRQRALLAALLLDAGRPVPAARLIDAVWHEPPWSAAHAVEVYVSKLRKTFAAAGRRDLFLWRERGYVAALRPGELDLERFRTLNRCGAAAAASGDAAEAARAYADSLALWRGEPLACLDGAPIVERARLELEDERLEALEGRLGAELALGRHLELVGELRRLVASHPERETLWCKLMLALYRCGRQAEALETFTLARGRLREQLGLEPGPELRELQRRILEHDPALDPPVRAGAAVHRAPVVLPSPPSGFVGRGAELEAATALLGQARLLTVVGPGGVGKTRFAIELARRNAHRYQEVVWAGLDSLNDPTLVLVEIARRLGVDDRGGGTLDALSRALARRQLLLVLDNLEHVLDCAADLHELLAHSPGLHLLLTSREPLRLSAEQRYVLPPLEPADARILFGARAAAVGAAPESADGSVDALCARLDRLPLAIELAASHADTHPPALLLATLGRCLDLDGRRDPPDRQRTMRATITWSYRLLTADEQRVLRGIGVFSGGCTAEAAEAIAGALPDVLQALVDKNLLQESDGRFSELETIRDLASELLEEAGEAADVAARHAAWYLRLAQALAPPHYGASTTEALATVSAETPNFLAALGRAVREADAGAALSLVRALAPHWYELDGLPESYKAAVSALGLAGGDPRDRGHCLYFAACVTMEQGRAAETNAHIDAAEEAFASVRDLRGLSTVEALRCYHSSFLGDHRTARAQGVRAVELAREAGAEDLEQLASIHLAITLFCLARAGPEPDPELLESSRELMESFRDWTVRTGKPLKVILLNLSPVLRGLGRYEEALSHAQRGLRLELADGDRRLPDTLVEIGLIAAGQERHREAVVLTHAGRREIENAGRSLHSSERAELARVDDAARSALGGPGFRRAAAESCRLTLEDAVDLALRLDAGGEPGRTPARAPSRSPLYPPASQRSR
jgi:predicted ATPase/DNA-binding SARP family transcriptional activator